MNLTYFPKEKSKLHLNRYITFIKSRSLRVLSENSEVERHHIVPKCFCLNQEYCNSKENIIELSSREHYIAHMMLWKAFGGKMTYVFNMMTNFNKLKTSSKLYESLKREAKLQNKEYLKRYYSIDKNRQQRGDFHRGHSYEDSFGIEKAKKVKEKLSVNARLRFKDKSKHPMYGKPLPEETKEKIRKKTKGKSYEEKFGKEKAKEMKMKCSKRSKGKTYEERYGPERAELQRKNLSKKLKGKKRTEETKKKLSEIAKNRKLSKETKKKIGEKSLNRICINNGKSEKKIYLSELDFCLNQGWMKGRITKSYIGITNGKEDKKIPQSKLSHYLNLGWTKGSIKKQENQKGHKNPSYRKAVEKYEKIASIAESLILCSDLTDKEIYNILKEKFNTTFCLNLFIEWDKNLKFVERKKIKQPNGYSVYKTVCELL